MITSRNISKPSVFHDALHRNLREVTRLGLNLNEWPFKLFYYSYPRILITKGYK